MDRDYTHVFFGLVVFAGVIAMLLMVAPNGTQNRIGAAYDSLAETDSKIQEFSFSQGSSVTVAGKTITFISPTEISIDGEQRTIVLGDLYALDPRRTFIIEEETLYVFDVWEADSCKDIYGQTRLTSPGSICCGSDTSVPLPDCSESNTQEIQCGEKRIYCENGQLRSEVTQ